MPDTTPKTRVSEPGAVNGLVRSGLEHRTQGGPLLRVHRAHLQLHSLDALDGGGGLAHLLLDGVLQRATLDGEQNLHLGPVAAGNRLTALIQFGMHECGLDHAELRDGAAQLGVLHTGKGRVERVLQRVIGAHGRLPPGIARGLGRALGLPLARVLSVRGALGLLALGLLTLDAVGGVNIVDGLLQVLNVLADVLQLLGVALLLLRNVLQFLKNVAQLATDEVSGRHLAQSNTQRSDLAGQVLGLLQVLLVTLTVLGGHHAVTVVLTVLREQQQGSGVGGLQRQHQGQQGEVQATRVELHLLRRQGVPGQPHATENGHPHQELRGTHVARKRLGHAAEGVRVGAGEQPRLAGAGGAQLRVAALRAGIAALAVAFSVLLLQAVLENTRLIDAGGSLQYGLRRAFDQQKLLRVPPSEPIGHILDTDTEPVSDQASLEELARVLATYDLTIVPIVNDSHRLVGAVTIDDVLDALLPEDWQLTMMELPYER